MLAVSVLGLLMSEPLHGYEIRKQLSSLLGISGAISYGSLYPTLAKLASQGLIETSVDGSVNTRSKSQTLFSTGSLTGDISLNSKLPFAKATQVSPRKKKKVYSITTKGKNAFLEKLYSSFENHGDDDRAFVAHLAFLNHSDQAHVDIFIESRSQALLNRLEQIQETKNLQLKKWNDIERQYIHTQISFLESLKNEAMVKSSQN